MYFKRTKNIKQLQKQQQKKTKNKNKQDKTCVNLYRSCF